MLIKFNHFPNVELILDLPYRCEFGIDPKVKQTNKQTNNNNNNSKNPYKMLNYCFKALLDIWHMEGAEQSLNPIFT